MLRGLAAVVRGDFGAAALARFATVRFAVERFGGDFRAADARLAPPLADFARAEAGSAAVFRVALVREEGARFARFAGAFRALLDLPEDDDLLVVVELSIDHLPDMISLRRVRDRFRDDRTKLGRA